ncbi:MAG: carboxylesterase family protein [Phascolarctobacterium sp.]|nr:carboxylesterase family protein [Phascolarctobacterium sp.]
MKKSSIVTALSLCMALGFAFDVYAEGFSTSVKTREGIVNGVQDTKHATINWWGIPYADGSKRFEMAKPLKAHKEALDCSKVGSVNVQFNGKKVIGEEGALVLDITRPNTDAKNLPVLVFIHGGNNQTSNSRLWMGQKFAEEANVVYVSIQYRLGVFGWNNLPAIAQGNKWEESGNLGFADQYMALSWVRDNIKAFGGNPDNVTVSGFSAGGRDVMAMLISPEFKGKFQKAISFSGGCTVANYKDSQNVIAKNIAPLVVEDGVKDNILSAKAWLLSTNKKDMKAVRNYLTNVKAERLAPLMAGAGIRMSAFPHLYGDGNILPKKGFATKSFNSVPLMMLASTDEFSSFARRDKFFKDRMDAVISEKEPKKEFRFANKYGSLMYGYFNGQESAENIYKSYKNKMYVTAFNFGHNKELVGENYNTTTGAIHGIWLSFLSDQPYPWNKEIKEVLAKPGPKELSKAFIASLGAFMRTGNPNTPELGQTWNAWTPNYKPELVFDAHENMANIYSSNSRVTYAGILAEMEDDNSISKEAKDYIIANVLNGRWFSNGLDEKYGNINLWK